MHVLFDLCQMTALRHIAIDLQDGCGLPRFVADQHPTTFDDHLLSIFASMDEITFPMPFCFQKMFDCFLQVRKVWLKKGIFDVSEHFLRLPSVEIFCSLVPGDDLPLRAADENSVMGKINQAGL